MTTMIRDCSAGELVLLAIWMINRRKSTKAPDLYVCNHCGEKDCGTKQEKGNGDH